MPRHPDHDETISEANKKLRKGEKGQETGKDEKGHEEHAHDPANDDRESGRK